MVGLRRKRGREFKVKQSVARVLEKIGVAARVVRAAPEAKEASSAAHSTTALASDDLTALRAEYKELFGRAPYASWDAAEVRGRIEAKKAAG